MTADSHGCSKDFLNEAEMNRLLTAAKDCRNGVRDHLICLMLWRHGLRVSELIGMKRTALNLARAKVWVERCGKSLSAEHLIKRDELRALKRYLRTRRDKLPWLFVSERRTPFTHGGVEKIVRNAGLRAGLGKIHPHALRHSCGYSLVNKGWHLKRIQVYLGHKVAQHTTKYIRIPGWQG